MSVQTAIAERMFILTDAKNNNNKFWAISMNEAGVVTTRNGRVGSQGQSRVIGTGQIEFDAKIREKERKGYKAVDLVGAAPSSANVNGEMLASAAEDEIAQGNPVIAKLVRELVQINRHQIIAASGGQMDIDLATGIITTPLGVVTAQNIKEARRLLADIVPLVVNGDFDNPAFITPLQDYLMLVPQKVDAKRGWHRKFLTDIAGLTAQGALLDQLESSIDIAAQRIKDAKNKVTDKPSSIFDVRMDLNEDPLLRKRIAAFYEKSRNVNHVSHRLQMRRIFDVSLGQMDKAFAEDGARVGGTMELWHGTRAHNLLSILKSGLIIPKSNGSIHVTGRMFGDGLYFSDQSTKSLNYAYGYWDGGRKDNRCYMFLADVAMGKYWHPDRTGSSLKPPAGHDSIYARGGKDIVANNEMIVFRTSQAKLKYLVEFEL